MAHDKIKSIYIKPTKKKCSVSRYKTFEVYDQDLNRLDTGDIDVVDIRIENNKFQMVSMEVLHGMTHIWSHSELAIEVLINTVIIRIKE